MNNNHLKHGICKEALCKSTSNCNYWNEHLVNPKERYQKQNWYENASSIKKTNKYILRFKTNSCITLDLHKSVAVKISC